MAHVVAHVPDLMWCSKVQGMLAAAGHDVTLAGSPSRVREAIGGGDARVLASYAHTAPEVRARALEAGFDLVVPRSRMAREGAALVERLVVA
jgi:hypothetical protein